MKHGCRAPAHEITLINLGGPRASHDNWAQMGASDFDRYPTLFVGWFRSTQCLMIFSLDGWSYTHHHKPSFLMLNFLHSDGQLIILFIGIIILYLCFFSRLWCWIPLPLNFPSLISDSENHWAHWPRHNISAWPPWDGGGRPSRKKGGDQMNMLRATEELWEIELKQEDQHSRSPRNQSWE